MIKDLHQFKDINIDLTYPLGHAKAGEPLDKICIIGHSGTGKITLLKLIGGYTSSLDDLVAEYNPKESIEDDELLKQIVEILKVDPEVLKNLDLDAAINVISNTFTNHDHSQQQFATYVSNSAVYHPLEKLIELFEREKAELKAEIEKLKKGKK